jgi:hypothetical protein
MAVIVGAAIALAALAMAVAACIHRRDRSTTDLKALEFGAVPVTDAGNGNEDDRGSATRAAASLRVAPEAPLFGARQNGWTELDILQVDPTVCMYSYWGSILCGWC